MATSGLTPGEQAAIQLLGIIMASAVGAALISGGIMFYNSVRQFGHKGFFHSSITYLSVSTSFFAVYMSVAIIVAFGGVLMENPAGWAILIGLMGIETVGITQLIALWNARANGL
jgi:hypothetical protein